MTSQPSPPVLLSASQSQGGRGEPGRACGGVPSQGSQLPSSEEETRVRKEWIQPEKGGGGVPGYLQRKARGLLFLRG